MKTKLLALVATTVLVLTASLLWLLDSKVQEERKTAGEIGLRGPVNAVALAMQADLRGLRRALPTTPTSKINWPSFKPFFAIGQVQFTDEGPKVSQFANSGTWIGPDWSARTAESVLAGLRARPSRGDSMLAILTTSDQRKVVAAIFADGDPMWVAFAGPEFLQGLLDLQKGPKGWIAAVNSAGQVLAHSTVDYVGTSVASGSLMEHVLHGGAPRGFEAFDGGVADASLAAFQKVEGVDVTVIAARPLAEIRAERRRTLVFGALAGFGVLLLALSTAWSMLGAWEERQRRPIEAARATLTIPSPPKTTEASAPAMGLKERQEAFGRIASTLGYELRSPLIAVLGYAHSILSFSKDKEISEHAESVVRETRAARDVVDKLLAYAGESPGEKQPGRIETVLARVLKEFETRFLQKHVKLQRELRDTSEFPMAPAALEKAIRHVLSNAVEAMERLPKKEIQIRLTEDPTAIRLEIQDNGEGISDADKPKIFDPFFTTRKSAQHLGMGLPAALGLLRDHGAAIQLKTALGKGTTVIMEFPKKQKTVEIAGETVELRTEAVVEIPASLPVAEPEPIPAAPAAAAGTTPSPATSPVDVDIDRLLALPEEKNTAVDSKDVAPTPTAGARVDFTAADLERELGFSAGGKSASAVIIDTSAGARRFDDDKTPPLSSLPSVDAAADLRETMGAIDRPSFEAPKRENKLDSFRATVRRPGARPS